MKQVTRFFIHSVDWKNVAWANVIMLLYMVFVGVANSYSITFTIKLCLIMPLLTVLILILACIGHIVDTRKQQQ